MPEWARQVEGQPLSSWLHSDHNTTLLPCTTAGQEVVPTPYSPAAAAHALPPAASSAHTKTHHTCTTPDGWRLHLVRTQQPNVQGTRRFPVVLCPGLGSSGAYTFDLSPVVSLADYFANHGFDVWTAELRGNGQSDKPRLLVRSRWWTIDTYVEVDLPAVLRHVLAATGAPQAHVVGHSMGGMILTRLLARQDGAAAMVRSGMLVASGCFLEDSWWRAIRPTMWLARFLWTVPASATLRLYSPLALGRLGVAALDQLYVWPPNTDPTLARAVLARNFSAISSGVIVQFASAFGPKGLMTADGRQQFADAELLAKVPTPVMFMCGDRDRMCPSQGVRATCALFTGSSCARYVEVGPAGGQRHHYGHFDILMGRHVEQEVFPSMAQWLAQHDHGQVAGGGGGAVGVHAGAGLPAPAAPSPEVCVPNAAAATEVGEEQRQRRRAEEEGECGGSGDAAAAVAEGAAGRQQECERVGCGRPPSAGCACGGHGSAVCGCAACKGTCGGAACSRGPAAAAAAATAAAVAAAAAAAEATEQAACCISGASSADSVSSGRATCGSDFGIAEERQQHSAGGASATMLAQQPCSGSLAKGERSGLLNTGHMYAAAWLGAPPGWQHEVLALVAAGRAPVMQVARL